MNWNNGIRQTHRWLSIAFTVGVIVNIIAIFVLGGGEEQPPFGVYLLALLPLFTLLPTGLYLFALPHGPLAQQTTRLIHDTTGPPEVEPTP